MEKDKRTPRISLALLISWKKKGKEEKKERKIYQARTPQESGAWGELPYCPEKFPEQREKKDTEEPSSSKEGFRMS